MDSFGPARIGIDIRIADPVESGQQRYLWRLGRWLDQQGDEVHYLTVKPQRDEAAPPGTARLHRLDGLGRRALHAQVRRLELDVLFLNPERSRPYRGLVGHVLRPAYGTEHYRQKLRSFRRPLRSLGRKLLRAAPWEVLERRWERAFYEAPDPPPEVIANSAYMKREILASYDIPPEHVHVVHNGVDPTEFSPARRAELRAGQRAAWGIPDGATCLLFMGHNYRLKGLWQLLEIVARLREEDPGLHLIVAGRGTGRGQRREARRRVERLGLETVVHLVGIVHPAERAFAAADAFIHLSWHDSFGFVTLEAMASGIPVITTPFVGACEIIEDGVDGVVVDPREAHAVGDGIRRLLDPELRARMGAAAAEKGLAHTEEENFRQVHEILRSAAARTRGRLLRRPDSSPTPSERSSMARSTRLPLVLAALLALAVPGACTAQAGGPATAAAPGTGAALHPLSASPLPALVEDLARFSGLDNQARGDTLLRIFRERGLEPEVHAFPNPQAEREPRPEGRNLVVTLGSGPREIVVGAHYDASPLPGGRYTGGAVDNGAGAVVLTRVAESLRGHELAHRVRVILFDLEEWGLLGSAAYVADNDPAEIAAMVNVDIAAYGSTLTYGPGSHDGNEAPYSALRMVCAVQAVSCLEFADYPVSDDRTFQAAEVPNVSIAILDPIEAHQFWLLMQGGAESGLAEGVMPRVARVIHTEEDRLELAEAAAMTRMHDAVVALVLELDRALR